MLFDGATNVQNSRNIMVMRYPRIMVLHGTEQVISFLFKDFYEKIPELSLLQNFTQQARNMFGSTRHAPTEMFGNYRKNQNKGTEIGVIKPCNVRMAGEFK